MGAVATMNKILIGATAAAAVVGVAGGILLEPRSPRRGSTSSLTGREVGTTALAGAGSAALGVAGTAFLAYATPFHEFGSAQVMRAGAPILAAGLGAFGLTSGLHAGLTGAP